MKNIDERKPFYIDLRLTIEEHEDDVNPIWIYDTNTAIYRCKSFRDARVFLVNMLDTKLKEAKDFLTK